MNIFRSTLRCDPAGDLEAFVQQAPARWVVYLLSDESDQPIQLLCVKNLRASLKRRLGGQEMVGPSRKVNYRDVVRHVHWRRVDSAFEADCVYLEAARSVFLASYQGMIGFRPAWFIHVDPDARFPRFVKTPLDDPARRAGEYLGPIEDKHAAARLVELLESTFELCRFYNILVQAPHGKACAYKEMGKCPAPCDGSIAMDQYHEMIREAAQSAVDPGPFIADQTGRMNRAAADLKFELAAKYKGTVDQAAQLGSGPFRHVRLLEDFAFLSLQRGPWANTAKLFLITPGQIEEVAGLIDEPKSISDLLRHILDRGQDRAPLTHEGAERIGLVSQHLFAGRSGMFLPLADVEESAVARAFKALRKQKVAEETEGEGVVKELQAMP